MSDLREPTAILLDIDGTVVNYNLQIPDSAREAIAKARANGHEIYLCTGRAKAEIYEFLWELGIDGLILGNGAYVEHDGEVVHRQIWDEAMAGATYDTSRGHDDVNKISFPMHKDVDLEALAKMFDGEAKISTWTASGKKQEFGEFGQIGIHKAVGVNALSDHLGVDTATMIAFGDAAPDIELIELVGTGVAMGNGEDALKERADLVTDHIDEDGLANAFKKLGLI